MAPDDRAPVVEEELDDDVMGATGRQSRAAWHAEKMRECPGRQSVRRQRPRPSRARGAIDEPRAGVRSASRASCGGATEAVPRVATEAARVREGACGAWAGDFAKAHAADGAVARVLRENARAEEKRSGR